MTGWVYLVIGGGSWGMDTDLLGAAFQWRMKRPGDDQIPVVLRVHPDTKIDKDNLDVRYPQGKKPKLLGTYEKGRLQFCN